MKKEKKKKSLAEFIKYLQGSLNFYFINKLFILLGTSSVALQIIIYRFPTHKSSSIPTAVDLPPIAMILKTTLIFLIHSLCVLFDLWVILFEITNITLLPKKSILFFLKIILNLPLMVVIIAYLQHNLGMLLGIFYPPLSLYGDMLLSYLLDLSPFTVGASLLVAGIYNLFYLTGYGYKPFHYR